MTHKLITTADGSSSLFVPELNESYHSTHGALTESQHVFVNAGLKHAAEKNGGSAAIRILEMGMGTGLNVLLTLLYAQANALPPVLYHAVEAHPLPPEQLNRLNYTSLLKVDPSQGEMFGQIHLCEAEKEVRLAPGFTFCKWHQTLQSLPLSRNGYELVYFDAFAPNVQPELWEAPVFEKLHQSMAQGGILVTYCAKGSVKRTLKQVGFAVEALPGPPGKREMTRALKC